MRAKLLGIIVSMVLLCPLVTISSSATASASQLPIRGICIGYYMSTSPVTASWLKAEADNMASYLAALGTNEVELGIPIFVPSYNANSVFAGTNPSNSKVRTPTPAEAGVLIDSLAANGIAVDIRPVINEDDIQPSHWRGSLAPANRAAWFQSYKATIAPFVQLAQTDHTASFTIQSELMSLGSDPHWSRIINWARSVYTGQLIWNPSLNGYVGGAERPYTSLSLDMYPPINLPTSATIGQLASAWTSWFQTTAKNFASFTPSADTIGEVGILAQDGAYQTPWYHSSTGAFDQKIQANWFAASCQFAKKMGFKGMYFFTLFFPTTPPSLTTPNTAVPQIFQPQALQAIKSCFGS